MFVLKPNKINLYLVHGIKVLKYVMFQQSDPPQCTGRARCLTLCYRIVRAITKPPCVKSVDRVVHNARES